MASDDKISEYLKGLNFPANKNEIAGIAKNNDAPGSALKSIKHLPKDRYMSIDELKMELGLKG